MPDTTYSENDLRDALARRSLDDGAEPDVSDFRARLGLLIADTDTTSVSADDAPVAYLTPMATEPGTDEATPEAAASDGGQVFDLIPRTERGRRGGSRRRLGYLAVAAAACVALGAAGIAALHGSGTDHGRPTTNTPTLATNIPSSVPKQIRDSYYPGTQYVGLYTGTGSRTITLPSRALPKYYQWMGSFTCSGSATDIEFGGNQVRSETLCEAGSADGTTLDPNGRMVRVTIKAGASWKLWVFQTPETRSSSTLTEQADVSRIAADLTNSGNPHVYRTGRGDGTVQVRGLSVKGDPAVDLSCTGTGVTIDGFTPEATTGGVYTDTCFEGVAYRWTATKVGSSMTLHVHASKDTSWRILVY